MSSRSVVVGAIVVGSVWLAPTPAQAQSICANFWAQQTGTYGDLAGVTVTGVPTTPPPQATQDTITGFLISAGGSFTYAYDSPSQVARWDLQVVDVDPGEEVQVDVGGAMFTVLPEHLLQNPSVTTQPLNIVNGRLRSQGADGSAYLEIFGIGTQQLRIAATGGSVIVYAITNSFCQCANGNKHFNEDCDDGGTATGDGCDADCVIEPGWTCTGNPSTCTLGGIPDASPPDASPPDASIADASPADASAEVDAAPGLDAEGGGDAGREDDAAADDDDDGGGGGGCCGASRGGGGSALCGLAVLAVLRRRRRG